MLCINVLLRQFGERVCRDGSSPWMQRPAGFVQSLMGLKRTVPRSGCCRAQCYVGIWAVPFSFWLLLFFGTAVVACTSDIGAYVGMVEEAGWGVVDEEAYLFGHDGDGVLAE